MRCALRPSVILALLLSSLDLSADIIIHTFHDHNNNGVRDNSELLVTGLQVRGFDDSATEWIFLDDGMGQFVLPGFLIRSRIRVEVSGYNDQLRQGKNRPTTVFFASDGDQIEVPVLLEQPLDPNATHILVPCHEKGASQLKKDSPAFVRFPFSARGIAAQFGGSGPNPVQDASISEIGSTWGVAYQRSHERAFVGTLLKRHVGMGPQGPGAVYVLDYRTGKPAISHFNLQGITPSEGPAIDLGSVRREIVDAEIDQTMPYALSTIEDRVRRASYDVDAYDKVGQTAYGDIEMGENGRTLWMVNLNQRSLMTMDVGDEEIRPTEAGIRNYLIDELPGIPNLNFRFRLCINAGGNSNLNGAEAFTDPNGASWDKNKYAVGGQFGHQNFAVSNLLNGTESTSSRELYQSFRRGDFRYDIPVPLDEPYEVMLHFAEPENLTVGDRLFDIVQDDQVLVENFDIVKHAGGAMKATVLKLTITSNDRLIRLGFVSKAGARRKEALLAGIEVAGQTISQSGVLRPWALAFHQGRGYLGVVSDASHSQSREHLFAYLLSFDPGNITAGLTEELAFPLNYPRERASNAHLQTPQSLRSAAWMPWARTWEETMIPTRGEPLSIQGGLLCAYAQPIFSKISFGPDGSIILGMMDRWAHQVGHLNYSTDLGDRTLLIGYAAGDVLKVFREPDGRYILEKTNSDDGLYYRKDDGPGYQGEFFYEDHFISPLAHHGEIFTGGQALLPGSDLVAVTVHSPIVTKNPNFLYDGLLTQGLHFYNMNTGRRAGEYLFVEQFVLGKANGLGDIAVITEAAPPAVGNYVWCDANSNGVQDPTEFGINGIHVTLHDGEEALIQLEEKVTINGGQFYFDNLLPNHHYQLRIDLDEMRSKGYSGLVAPFQTGDSLTDSDADDTSLPGFAIIDFVTGNDGLNRDDLDFGFLGPPARDIQKILCEDVNIPPFDQPCADFSLAGIIDSVSTAANTIVSIYPTFGDAENLTNEIVSNIRVCGLDSLVYARVSIVEDLHCFAISEVHLMVLPGAGGQDVDFVELICPDDLFDALAYLQAQDFRGDATTIFYTDPDQMVPYTGDPSAIDPADFPFTLYYDDTLIVGGCGVTGSITLNMIPGTSVFAGRDTSLCGLDCIDLTLLGATFYANGTGATDAIWSSSGTGTFIEDNTFAGAHFYCPDAGDLALGRVILTLTVTDDPCMMPPPSASVEITLTAGTPRFLDDPRDTIDCYHPFTTNPAAYDSFPGCRLIIECIDTLVGDVVNYEFLPGDCINLISQVKRTFRFTYNQQEFTCMDTIVIRALPDTLICPPEKDSVYCVPGYLRDQHGRPSPLETGVPMAGDIPLWPPLPGICDILIDYLDVEFTGSCPKTIRREWYIKNTCTGRLDSCLQWIMIFDTTAPVITKLDTATFLIPLPAGSHHCEAETYIPRIMVEDTCTGVKQVKAMINGQIFEMHLNPLTGYYESQRKVRLPVSDIVSYGNLPVISYVSYEVMDSCHNLTIKDSLPLVVIDDTKPVAICDKGLNITITDPLIWLPAETLDEGSWDNCGLAFLLARRADWSTACGVDLCDSLRFLTTGHHDSLFLAILESSSALNAVEAHYQKTLNWLCEDDRPCSWPLLLGWTYDLLVSATVDCRENSGPFSKSYLDQLLYSLPDEELAGLLRPSLSCLSSEDQPGTISDIASSMTDHWSDVLVHDLLSKPAMNFSNLGEALTTLGKQVGGGWSTAVPFCCEDACQTVMVELLAMDYWCNWSKCWTTVYVEDKTPPMVVAELADVSISCTAYEKFYAGAVDKAINGQFEDLQNLLGRYDKVTYDAYGKVPGPSIFSVSDVLCDSAIVRKDSLVYDEHLGYIWKTYTVFQATWDTVTTNRFNGQVADQCGLQCFEEKPWINLDPCGQGYVKRVFKFVGQCSTGNAGPMADTIVRTQTIRIKPDCRISPAMFRFPTDTIIHHCGVEYEPEGSGKASGMASPVLTGEVQYIFSDQCRQVGIGYYDRVFKIVGGKQGCYKILRTWCMMDWCTNDLPVKSDWWWDPNYKDKYLTFTQKIIIFDNEAPDCTIDIPSQLTTPDCFYHLETNIHLEDGCGVIDYQWELLNTKTGSTLATGSGQHNSGSGNAIGLKIAGIPEGTYNLRLVARDDCQNERFCNQPFEVTTGKKPIAVCLSSLTVDLVPMDRDLDGSLDTAMAIIWAKEFNQSSTAACGASADGLTFRIAWEEGEPVLPPPGASYLELGCEHAGSRNVRLYVLDHSGTWDYCTVRLIVQNNAGGCSLITSGTGFDPGLVSSGYRKDVVRNVVEGDVEHWVLLQNRPNPFRKQTVIGFFAPEAAETSLSVYDLLGRRLRSWQGPAVKGYNEWQIEDSSGDLPAGILYYKLETVGQTILGKMFHLD